MHGSLQPLLEGFVGTTLILAALAKLVSQSSVAALLEAVGLPRRLAPTVAPLVPAVELGVGFVVVSGAFPGAVVACLLSLAFLAFHLLNQRKQAPVACNCFGRLDLGLPQAVPIVRATTLALAAAALMVVSLNSQLELVPRLTADVPAVATGLALSLAATLGVSLIGATWHFRRDRLLPLASGSKS